MSTEQLSYDAALAALQAARPVVQPNPGFALQLQEFGRSGCCLDTWKAWDEARLDHCFAQVIMCPCSSCVCVCGWGGCLMSRAVAVVAICR